jgi:Fic family protein
MSARTNHPFHADQPFDVPPLTSRSVPMSEWENAAVLKACVSARASLAALNQAIALLPNPDVLLSSLVLLESQASSEIENIVTTTDALFQYAEHDTKQADAAIKETLRYREALFHGLKSLEKRALSTGLIEEICTLTKGVEMSVRRVPGTTLMNPRTGAVIYTPPQGEKLLRDKLADWERFCHAADDDATRGLDLDPLTRMAVLHYQFEAIHPFLDGNGRTGRIINLLFLVEKGLLARPILYLSRYILQHRARYYALLLAVSREGTAEAWQAWIIYVLHAVSETADWTLAKISAIRKLMDNTHLLINLNTKLGRQTDLINLIFRLPYCRVADVVDANIAKRQTAAVYLQTLAAEGFLVEKASGREKLYLNQPLIDLLKDESNHVDEVI